MIRNQGCSANEQGVGTHPKKWRFQNSLKLILKQNMKNVWVKKGFRAFPPRYTPVHNLVNKIRHSTKFEDDLQYSTL